VSRARRNAVPGDREALGRHEVGGGEAERAPALVAVRDLAGDQERRAEETAGVLDAPPRISPRM
jgi:hypothetical protein